MNDNWIGWNDKSSTDEVVDLVMAEVNDILEKHNIRINHQYDDDNEEGWDFFLELTKENICQKEKQ